jgi:asparagine synthase (glutamine-hydrolysing)
MTIFAGVFSLDRERNVPPVVADDLRKVISRAPGDHPEIRVLSGCTVGFQPLETLPGSGVFADERGALTLLYGDPLVSPRHAGTRYDDLCSIHGAWMEDDDSILRRARGSFCVVQIDPIAGRLRMATDKLGERPLYVSFTDGFIYFSTALRILEGLSTLPLKPDVRGLMETAGFGYALGTRTRYAGVELMDGGEVIAASRDARMTRRHYWQWSDITPSELNEIHLAGELHRVFQDAVHWRLGNETNVLAHLSGGLDSRVTTASLLAEGAKVHTLNIAPEGTLDLHLGRMLATHLGTTHFEFSRGHADTLDRVVTSHAAWLASIQSSERPECSSAVWTGTGGSVGMGHVYLNANMVSLLRQGRRAEAVAEFLALNRFGLPIQAFRQAYKPAALTSLADGVLDQLQRLDTFDEGRKLHLFLMLNDQRRHLEAMHEAIDLVRLECINPFFDAEFLRFLVSAPIDPFLDHRLYNSWLRWFPFTIDKIPWQSYPRHDPCPIAMPEGLREQWTDGWHSKEGDKEAMAKLLKQAFEALRSQNFLGDIVSKPVAMLAWRLTQTGVRDYSHVLKLANVFSPPCGRSRK